MNTVEPIRDFDLILDIADYLKGRNERDYVLFMFGIYSGLRISDILPLKVRDVRNADFIYKREQKTNKEKRFAINNDLKEILNEYIVGKRDYEYLFPGTGRKKPLTRQRAWQILNEAADYFGIKDKIGTHTLRKTFGYWVYQKTKDLAALQDIFNHDSVNTTRRYIGINQDTKDEIFRNVSFKRKY